MKIINIFIGLLLPLNAAQLQAAQNLPLADPFILYYNDKYYAYGTSDANGIVVYTSDDLQYWSKQPTLALHKNNSYADRWFWAPEVYHVNGKFLMYYSADEHICVATSDSPLGPFVQSEKQPMLPDKAIDNSLFIDDDGKAYIFFVRFTDGNAIWMAELENDYTTIKTATMRLCFAANTSGWEADMGKVNEGPFVVKHKGYYYLTYSANDYQSQNYGVGFAFTTDLSGTWTKYSGNPILQKPGQLVGSGHHCLFLDKDQNLKMAFHAHKSVSSVQPRETYITSVSFTNPARGLPIMQVSADYQPLYIYDSSSSINSAIKKSDSRIIVKGKNLKIEGDYIKNVALFTVNGYLWSKIEKSPFSFKELEKGVYFAVIKYNNNVQETRKILI
jgi:beta-xylosidase